MRVIKEAIVLVPVNFGGLDIGIVLFQVCIKASNGADSIVPEEVDFSAESVRSNPSILRLVVNVGGGFNLGSFPAGSSNASYQTSKRN